MEWKDLINCPVCGAHPVIESEWRRSTRVVCVNTLAGKCEARTKIFRAEADALNAWNAGQLNIPKKAPAGVDRYTSP